MVASVEPTNFRHAANKAGDKKARVNIYLSENEQQRFLENVRLLGCSKTDYIRFVFRLALIPEFDLKSFCKCTFKTSDEARNINNVARVGGCLLSDIQASADALGTSRANLIRALVLMPIKLVDDSSEAHFEIVNVPEIKKGLTSMRSEVLRIGNNCNQIAHALNICKNRNWLPADHAEPIFSNANDSLNKIGRTLSSIDDKLTDSIAQLPCAGDKLYPRAPRAISSRKQG